MYICVYIYSYILFQILIHCRLLQDIEYSSLCYIVVLVCFFFFLFYILWCVYVNPKLLIYFLPSHSSFVALFDDPKGKWWVNI